MTRRLALLPGSTLLLALPFAGAAHAAENQLLAPDDIKWGPGPASVPAGAEAAVLYGDPAREGLSRSA